MDITRHDLEKHKILIDVTIPPEELKTYVETAYKVIAESAQLEIPEDADPKPYVEKALGKDDADSMVDNLVMNAAAPLAVTRLRLDPFTSPQVGSEDHADPEKDFAFTCILYTKPEAHLSSYDPVELTIPKPEPVTEKDIDDELEYMARNFAEEDASGNAVIPAISDNWVRDHFDDCDSLPQLRKRLKAAMTSERKQRREEIMRYGCANEIAERLECDIPDDAVKIIQAEARRAFEAELIRQGQDKKEFFESTGITEEQFHNINNNQVLGTIRRGLALDALADHLDIKLSEDDYLLYFHDVAPGHEEETLEEYREAGRMYTIRESIRRTLATDWLVENSTIKEA